MTQLFRCLFFIVFAIHLASQAETARAADVSKIVLENLPASPPAWVAGYRVRYPLRVVGDPAAQPSKSIIARLPSGCLLRPDGADVAVQNAAGAIIPSAVLSNDPKGDTIIQFARSANDKWYWAYASNPAAPVAASAPAIHEGLVAEYRNWAGTKMDTWADVVEGLKKSNAIIGTAALSEVVFSTNTARPDDPRHVATSYRGFLNIKTAGAYRFLINAQDASFLFIDGLKVLERGGLNDRFGGRIPLNSSGAVIDLTAGVHPFEIHHVIGDRLPSAGACVFLWVPPGSNQWGYVPTDAFAQPMYATVADVQESAGGQIATFGFGVDDVLPTAGPTLFLVRFEAQGSVKDPAQLSWDFGDGSVGMGTSVTHVYFKDGPYVVKLKSSPNVAAYERTVCVWGVPVVTSPFSLGKAVKALAALDWHQADVARLNEAFNFVLTCEEPSRWPLLETLSREVLNNAQADPEFRASAYVALIESMARQGKGKESLQLVDPALKEFEKLPGLAVRVKLEAADVNFRHLREIEVASRLYRQIVEENRRLETAEVRLAAVRLGDVYAEIGELPKAAEAYRIAGTLGGAELRSTAQTDAITRGAMLRVAEQRLRAGDVWQTRQLMEKIETNFPEQKLEGLYRFLRAESDRIGGRYEDAIDNYQFLLKMPQWGGYRAKALFGVADSYAREGDDAKALELLTIIEHSFQSFYEEQKLSAYRRMIEMRIARDRADAATSRPAATTQLAGPFVGFSTSFESIDEMIGSELRNCSLVYGLGMGGKRVGLLESMPASKGPAEWKLPLRSIRSNGYYWIELWQRGSRDALSANSFITVSLYGMEKDIDAKNGQSRIDLRYTSGQWQKLGFLLRAPLTQDGRIELSIQLVRGAMELDAISVTPVSDRQYDALLTFSQRGSAP